MRVELGSIQINMHDIPKNIKKMSYANRIDQGEQNADRSRLQPKH